MLSFTDLPTKSTHTLLSRAQLTFLLRLCHLVRLCLNPHSDSVCSYVVTSPFFTGFFYLICRRRVKANIHAVLVPPYVRCLKTVDVVYTSCACNGCYPKLFLIFFKSTQCAMLIAAS